MKHLFILNPAAGKGKTLRLIPEIEKIFEKRNDEYVIEITKGEGHAVQIAKDYSSKEDYRIYSVGGDGTLNEVLNGMIGTSSSLAVIPSGSGNDFIKSICNYSKKENLSKLLCDTINGREKIIDIGRVNERFFLNISSIGFDAEVAYSAVKLKKIPFITGSIAYILGIFITLLKYKSYDLEIFIDDKHFKFNSLMAVIANGKYYGGGIFVAPEAEIDDGLFDICLIERVSRLKILALFPKVINGTHAEIKEVSFHRGRIVKIISEKDITFNIDGEIMRDKKAEFEIIRNAIKIIIP